MTLIFSTIFISLLAIIFLLMTIVYMGMPLIALGIFVAEAIALRKELRKSLDNDENNNNDSQGKSENNQTPSPYEWLAEAHDSESQSK